MATSYRLGMIATLATAITSAVSYAIEVGTATSGYFLDHLLFNPFRWIVTALSVHVDPTLRLHIDGARFSAANATQPHAGRFSAFIARVRSHRLFCGGMGFVPEWAI